MMMMMKKGAFPGLAIVAATALTLSGACDPEGRQQSDAEVTAETRSSQSVHCGYFYDSPGLEGSRSPMSDTGCQMSAVEGKRSVAIAPHCDVHFYDSANDGVQLGDENGQHAYEDLPEEVTQYSCSCNDDARPPVAEAIRGDDRLPLWEGAYVDLGSDLPNLGWSNAITSIRFLEEPGAVLASLGQDQNGNDEIAVITSEQVPGSSVDLAEDFEVGTCTSPSCSCVPVDGLECDVALDISGEIETITAFHTS